MGAFKCAILVATWVIKPKGDLQNERRNFLQSRFELFYIIRATLCTLQILSCVAYLYGQNSVYLVKVWEGRLRFNVVIKQGSTDSHEVIKYLGTADME